MVNHIFIALGLGIVAAILDVIPMIIQKRPRFTIYSMFLQKAAFLPCTARTMWPRNLEPPLYP